MRLGLRYEVFDIGVLPKDLLNLQNRNMSEIVQQLSKQQGKVTFLKYSSWLRYARTLFNCGENVARLYFETFLMVHRTTYLKRGSAKPMLSVDYGEFLVFLFLQKFIKHNSSSSSSSSSSPAKMETKTSTSSTLEAMKFLRNNIFTILTLLRDPVHHTPLLQQQQQQQQKYNSHKTSSSSQQQKQPLMMRRHEFTRLTFLVAASEGENASSELESFVSLAPFWSTKPNSEVPIETLCQWTLKHLREPVQVPEDLKMKVRQILPTIRIVGQQYSNKCIVIKDEELCGGDIKIHGCSNVSVYVLGVARFIQVSNCNSCTLNLGVCRKMITMKNCANMTITAASRRTHLSGLDNCRFYLFCWNRPVFIRPVRNVKLGPYNTHYPTIKSDMDKANLNPNAHNLWSEAIVFGEHANVKKNKNKSDTTLGKDNDDDENTTSTSAKMSPDECLSEESEGIKSMEIETKNSSHSKKRQRDDEEIGGDDDTTATHVRHQQQPEDISLMPPEEFFYEPFLLDKSCNSGSVDGDAKNGHGKNLCPFTLPQPYTNAHPLQRQRVLDLKNMIDTTDMNERQRKSVHSFIHEAFHKWLEDTKRLQHIKNVANYQSK
mmetsp:Transcript_41046/g.66726  ORF Transcript_41046/g.66726 Transcript_41046/m.66726 type:complete len:602 (+) Transcript_41046:95-1900(+)